MSDTPKLRLEDAEHDANLASLDRDYSRTVRIRALIALARAAKREVPCDCRDRLDHLGHDDNCAAGYCPNTAAELERWE